MFVVRTLVLGTAIIVLLSGAVFAKPVHHSRHGRSIQTAGGSVTHDDRYPFLDPKAARADRMSKRHRRHTVVADGAGSAAAGSFAAVGPSSSDPLIVEARRYVGTNPTGRRNLWCGAFLDMVLRHTGHPGGGLAAKAYAHYGRRISGPQVGAIAVMSRRGGGHVGIVTGIDPHGNPIIISGNYNHEVAETVYPRGRIFAYVLPN